MDLRRPALAACALGLWAGPPPACAQAASRPALVCTGALVQASNMAWDTTRIEFALDYARSAQSSSLKASLAPLNATLALEANDAFLLGRELRPRLVGAGRSIAITELKISRHTGVFSMVALTYRDLDVLEGRSLWEGSCSLQGSAEKKF